MKENGEDNLSYTLKKLRSLQNKNNELAKEIRRLAVEMAAVSGIVLESTGSLNKTVRPTYNLETQAQS